MQGVRIRRDNGRGSPYHMIMRASQTGTPFVYKKYSKKVIVYGVIVHQTNISYTNGVPVCKACIIIW